MLVANALTACVCAMFRSAQHVLDDYWEPLYERWYGDRMRLNEQKGWKFNFRSEDKQATSAASTALRTRLSVSDVTHPAFVYPLCAVLVI